MSTLPEVLAQHGLTPCLYLFFACAKCGELRAIVEEIPESRFMPCPSCNQEVEFVLMAEGATAKTLPFWEKAAYWLHDEVDPLVAFWKEREAISAARREIKPGLVTLRP